MKRLSCFWVLLALAVSQVHAQERRAPSVVRAEADATISSLVAGKLIELQFEEGALFAKGDPLAQIDCRILEAEADAAKAEVDAQRTAYSSAENLFNRGGSGRSNVEIALGNLQKSQARLRRANVLVEGCTISAPFEGRVSEYFVRQFEFVEPGQRLFTIISAGIPELEIIGPADWLSWLEVGTRGEVLLQATGKSLKIEVKGLAPIVDPVSGTIKIRAHFLHASEDVLPGMAGVVLFAETR